MNIRRPLVGNLRILGRLNSGGSWLAAEGGRGRQPCWVLKRLDRAEGGSARGVLREDLLDVASLRHPALALPSAFPTDEEGRTLLLRRFVEGTDLQAAAQGRGTRKLLTWLISAVEALAVLHRFGFLHRNLKPSNILIPRRALFSAGHRPGAVLCDPACWPSQGDAAYVHDLHALGEIFYRLLTGRPVEPGAGGLPISPREINADIPVDLERAVLKLLNPEPSRRYQDVEALLADLRSLGGKPEPERSPQRSAECFVGRKEELERTLTRLALPEKPAVIAVAGEAGIGKSAFLKRLSLAAELRGFRTRSSRFYSRSAAPFSAVRASVLALIPPGPEGRAARLRWRRLSSAGPAGTASEPGDPVARRLFLRGLIDLVAALGVRRPTLLVFDDVHLADPLSIDFLAGLARELGARTRESGPAAEGEAREPAPAGGFPARASLSLAVSFRSESPFRAQLRPLLDALSAPTEGHLSLELGPLGKREVEDWLGPVLREAPEREREELASRLGGNPFSIREALRLGRSATAGLSPLADLLPCGPLAGHSPEEKELLQALAVLGRPAGREVLGRVLGKAENHLRPVISGLVEDGTLTGDAGPVFFRHGSFHVWLLKSLGKDPRRSLHRRIALVLEKHAGESLEEIARHWLHSSTPRRGVHHALKAARSLTACYQDRRALVFYRAALKILPAGAKLRRRISEEAAEAYARAGEHRRSLDLLDGLLQKTRGRREAGSLHGRIGIFSHRSGEGRAAFHLEKGLSLLGRAGGNRWFRERLRLLSELAEIRSNCGDYDRAEALCRSALSEIEGRQRALGQPEVRRARMVLLENLAHLRLRLYRFEEARKLFQQSLAAGEGLGAIPEKNVLLNNLGILHLQQDRYRTAIDCYRQAERLSARLGDDQCLAAIHSNLAILYAKIGELTAAEESMRRAARCDLRCDSRRTHFLRLHAAGVVDLISGRYGSAIESFRESIPLGEELKDLHNVAFDLVYLGECLLYRGESRPAREALSRALQLGPAAPPPIPGMVRAREALLEAQRGNSAAAQTALAASGKCGTVAIPYLDSWNRFFRGWAFRLLQRREEAEEELEEARRFFSRVNVPAGEIQAGLELAALETDAGRNARAERRLQGIRRRSSPGQGALRSPLLAARLLAYQTRLLLARKDPDLKEAASCLVEAESCLIGRRMRDLEALLLDLRRRLRDLIAGEERPAPLPAPPSALPAEGLREMQQLRESAEVLVRRLEEAGGPEARSLRLQLRSFEERLEEARRFLEGGRPLSPAPIRANALVGSSPAMRKMVSLCLRLAPAPLPVLISGETGTGKELVARVVHGESPRRGGPFVTLSSAALPAELLEAELFGSCRGAFSGAEEDRPGLLRSAEGGTFLFDEIGDMPLALQAKIIRVLEERRVRPVGGTGEVPLDVRYLFTTRRSLQALVEEGGFRQDLFYRLSGAELSVPPLRERLEDLPELLEHFRREGNGGELEISFGAGALRALAAYPWPGNVRELRNLIQRLALTSGGPIGAEAVERYLGQVAPEAVFSPALLRSRPLDQLLSLLEREYLRLLSADTGRNLHAMAGRLGISLRTFYDRLTRLGLKARDLR